MRTARAISGLVFLLLWLAPQAKGDIAILLEEPYSYDGAFAGTGHSAVYLTRVCAASPVELRRCREGENGVVLSRYHRVGGYDWIAIPMTPYLYAVDNPEDVPLYADAKLVALLRDRYRRAHLESVAPNASDGEAERGDWPQLIGEAYDRTIYGFQIETTAAQDDEFIRAYNSRSNVAAYKLVSGNCADFVREAANFYYPHAVKRNIIADLDVMTPKQAAKSLVQYGKRHPDLHFSSLVIPQVPGSLRRSRPVHGLVESVFKAKKYEAPLMFFHPFIAVGFASAYLLSGRFDPAHRALVYDPTGDLEEPLSAQQRRAYSRDLSGLMRGNSELGNDAEPWKNVEAGARLGLDPQGRPILEVPSDAGTVQVGISRSNVFDRGTSLELTENLLETRLRQELRRGSVKASGIGLQSDWNFLQKVISSQQSERQAIADTGNQ
ncbi:MAG TPA: hypothetical protein VN862_04470 [Candidatus Acidoferrales bacterium]|nr:hypothetical protein [Candidatus Acidoferrales bacterium]